jgi:hypothetical protein
MTAWRTEFSAFVLDLLDFLEEKIAEAVGAESSRAAAIGEAAGAIPLLRERVREDQVLDTHFILALNNRYEARWAADWWEDFARMDRAEFERNARELIELVSILRTMVTKAGSA